MTSNTDYFQLYFVFWGVGVHIQVEGWLDLGLLASSLESRGVILEVELTKIQGKLRLQPPVHSFFLLLPPI